MVLVRCFKGNADLADHADLRGFIQKSKTIRANPQNQRSREFATVFKNRDRIGVLN